MEMLCKLLGKRFREESITASVVDLIKGMEGGNAAHRAGALKLALSNEAAEVSEATKRWREICCLEFY